MIAFLIFQSVRRKKRLIKELLDFAAEIGCTITVYDIWGDTRIGVDREKRYLFFIRRFDDSFFKTAIDINNVSVCKMTNVSHAVGDGKERQLVIDKILLSFIFKREKTDTNLEFYDSEKDGMQITDELQLAEKWEGIVNSLKQ